MFIELKDKDYPNIGEQKLTLFNILSAINPKEDFHFLSLSEDQFDLFGFYEDSEASPSPSGKVGVGLATLENTEHFYQSIQGDFAVKLLLQNFLREKARAVDTPKLECHELTNR